jgi:Fur family transcriptional regulator, ferric uptake regulator
MEGILPPIEILRSVGLKVTKNREQVLNILQGTDRPLNHHEIMEKLPKGQSWDRVTIYRALSDLEEKHILNTMLTGERVTYFELKEDLNSKKHHGHIVCDDCGRIECVEKLDNPFPKKLQGFKVQTMDITFHGICKECQD